MTEEPRILLLHDGELSEIADLLSELGLPFENLRGGEIPESLPPPKDLLVVTPRHGTVVGRAGNGERPVRIITVGGDSPAMREMLRDMGFHLLVRQGTATPIWRLLVQRACYGGDERRIDARLPVGTEISVGEDDPAVLVDLSNRGCRLLTRAPLLPDGHVTLRIPRGDGAAPLVVGGRVVRSQADAGGENEATTHTAAVLFDADLPGDVRAGLGALLNSFSTGAESLAGPAPGTALPPCASPDVPGLTLDDETDPAVTAGVGVGVSADPAAVPGDAAVSGAERRLHVRGHYPHGVIAVGERQSQVLMGRDLSAGGMRVERLQGLAVGDFLRMAIYGPSRSIPFEVSAEVVRDDGLAGFALRFRDVSQALAEELEKLVACLPDVESLRDGEASGLGAVVSEILPEPE